jgi:hypothetical protein
VGANGPELGADADTVIAFAALVALEANVAVGEYDVDATTAPENATP